MTFTSRALGAADAEVAERHVREAFAVTGEITPPRFPHERRGLWADGDFVAQTLDLHLESYVGGAALATAGIGNVTVAPEQRGRGVARSVMTDTLRAARARGAVLSTLFGGAPALYRSLGFELVARSMHWRIPLDALAGVRAPTGVLLREGGESDQAARAALYDDAARAGLLAVRRPPAAWLPGARTTLAESTDGTLLGYMDWRTENDSDEVVLRIDELVAAAPEATAALLRSAASWGSVARTATMWGTTGHPALLQMSGNAVPTATAPYMLRLLDVPAALAARGWSRLDGEATITVADELFPENAGRWRLSVNGGRMSVEAAPGPDAGIPGTPGISMTARGLALWFSGAEPLAQIERHGLAEISDPGSAALLDAWAVSPSAWISEHF